MVKPKQRRATYADIEKLPEHLTGEIIDGELVVSPRPAIRHAMATSSLAADLASFRRGADPGGWWILIEPELHLSTAASRRLPTAPRAMERTRPPRGDVLVPDLAGWRRERVPTLPDAQTVGVMPDWVCEILSPSTSRIDRSKKMRLYAREGVSHLWLVDPTGKTLEVYRLDEGRWIVAAVFGGDERVRAEPFDAIELDLARWWVE